MEFTTITELEILKNARQRLDQKWDMLDDIIKEKQKKGIECEEDIERRELLISQISEISMRMSILNQEV